MFKKFLLILAIFNLQQALANRDSRTRRNLNKLIFCIENKINNLAQDYGTEFNLLNQSNNKNELSEFIFNKAKAKYWFYNLSRYRSQIISDIKTLNIFKNKKILLNRNFDDLTIKIDLLFDQMQYHLNALEKLNHFVCNDPNFIIEENKHHKWLKSILLAGALICIAIPVIVFFYNLVGALTALGMVEGFTSFILSSCVAVALICSPAYLIKDTISLDQITDIYSNL